MAMVDTVYWLPI